MAGEGEADGALGIGIDEEGAGSGASEGVSEIDGEGGFTHASFLAGDGDADHAVGEEMLAEISRGGRQRKSFLLALERPGEFSGRCAREATANFCMKKQLIRGIAGIMLRAICGCGEKKGAEVKVPVEDRGEGMELSNRMGGLPGGVYAAQVDSAIDWQLWTKETFERAAEEDRLLFVILALPQERRTSLKWGRV